MKKILLAMALALLRRRRDPGGAATRSRATTSTARSRPSRERITPATARNTFDESPDTGTTLKDLSYVRLLQLRLSLARRRVPDPNIVDSGHSGDC